MREHPVSIVIDAHGPGGCPAIGSLLRQTDPCRPDWIVLSSEHTPAIDDAPEHVVVRHAGNPEDRLRALREALTATTGRYVFLIDGAVSLDRCWLGEVVQRISTTNEHLVCGPTIPCLSTPAPSWLAHSAWTDFICGCYAPKGASVLPEDMLPGAIVGIRTASGECRGVPLAPYPGGADVPLWHLLDFSIYERPIRRVGCLRRATARRVVGEGMWDLPGLLERAFRFGQSAVRVHRHIVLRPSEWLTTNRRSVASEQIDKRIILNLCYGELAELERLGDPVQAELMATVLASLEWSGDASWLADSAVAWLQPRLHWVPAFVRTLFTQTCSGLVPPGWWLRPELPSDLP